MKVDRWHIHEGKLGAPTMCFHVYEATQPFGVVWGVDTSIKLEMWMLRSLSEFDSMGSGENVSDGIDGCVGSV